MIADLDDLLAAHTCWRTRSCADRVHGTAHQITDAELVCLAVAQILLDCPKSERRFLRCAIASGTCSRTCPSSPATTAHARVGAADRAARHRPVAFASPSWCDNVRLPDCTPVPCAASRETVKRSDFAGHAAYGWCASHSRYFWGFRLYLLCASDGMPIALAPANAPEREVAARCSARRPRGLHRDRRQGLCR